MKEACEIAEHILKALVFVHENGVFHRDISPENVLLIMKNQEVAAAKLTDFGIAKVVDSGLTTAETSAYKFGYASPEQRVSLSAADARSDVYSTGMVVCRMVIGELPSGIHTRQPMESNPEICPGLNRWILKATMPVPDDRYQSAEEALSELRKIDKCENAATQEVPEEEQGGGRGQEGVGTPDATAPDGGQQGAEASETGVEEKRKKKKGNMAAAFAAVLLFIATGALIAFWPTEKSVSNVSDKRTSVDTIIESAPRAEKIPEGQVANPVQSVENIEVEKEESKQTKYSLRSQPKDVSEDEFLAVFNLDEHWKPKRYVENEYEDLGNGVVVDHATGMMWEKSGSPDSITYEKAEAYIRDLNRKKFAGFDDWRLPTVDELASLLEPEKRSEGLYIPPFSIQISGGVGHPTSAVPGRRGSSISGSAASFGTASSIKTMFEPFAPDNRKFDHSSHLMIVRLASLAFLAGWKSPSGKAYPATRTECCARGGGAGVFWTRGRRAISANLTVRLTVGHFQLSLPFPWRLRQSFRYFSPVLKTASQAQPWVDGLLDQMKSEGGLSPKTPFMIPNIRLDTPRGRKTPLVNNRLG